MKKFLSSIICFCFLFMNFSYAVTEELFEDNLVKDLIKSDRAKDIKKINTDIKKSLPNKSDEVDEDLIKTIIKNDVKLEKSSVKRAVTHDFEELNRPFVMIKPVKYVTTKNIDYTEGDYIEFKTVEPMTHKGKLYPEGTKVLGRIETITMNTPFGCPAEIIIDNFIIGSQIKAVGKIKKVGANRSYWVYPTFGFCLLLLGLGVLVAFIRGGHAKLKPNQEFPIYIVEQ